MTNWIIIFSLCALTSFKIGRIDMKEVRNLYHQAAGNENCCQKLIDISTGFNTNPVLLGYEASGTMLMAKHVFNPFTKMSYFKKGKEMLEKAIATDNNNIELRFLRFAAQTNMPSFLGYSNHIESDKNYIVSSFPRIKDENLKSFMLPVLMQSKYLTSKEKQQLY